MRLKGYFACLFLVTAIAAFLVGTNQQGKSHGQAILPGVRSAANQRPARSAAVGSRSRVVCAVDRDCASSFSLPMTIEANQGQAEPRVKFIARGQGITALMTAEGIEVVVGSAQKGMAGRVVKLRFGGELAEDRPISQSGESTAEKTKRPPRVSSAAPGGAHSRRRRKSGGASNTSRHRRARKKAARPRVRRKRAAGDSAPAQKQVPHQTAPMIPTAPREKNPPSGDAGSVQGHGDGRLAAGANYCLGNDPAKWRTHVQHFSRVVAQGVLPGV